MENAIRPAFRASPSQWASNAAALRGGRREGGGGSWAAGRLGPAHDPSAPRAPRSTFLGKRRVSGSGLSEESHSVEHCG